MAPAPPNHPPVRHGRIGVLLINLGTPDEPEAGAVRRYLGQFLSDPRVIEIPVSYTHLTLPTNIEV